MSRQTQFIGLSHDARNYLHTSAEKTSVRQLAKQEFDKRNTHIDDTIGWSYWKQAFDMAAHVMGYTPKIISEGTGVSILGMFGEPIHEIQKYVLHSGQVVEEYVQAQPWSSGPCIFLALRDITTKEPITESLWPDEDINNY